MIVAIESTGSIPREEDKEVKQVMTDASTRTAIHQLVDEMVDRYGEEIAQAYGGGASPADVRDLAVHTAVLLAERVSACSDRLQVEVLTYLKQRQARNRE